MNNQSGGFITQFFAWMAAVASAAGITTQDFFYILFGFLGAFVSVASFVFGRMDARKKRQQEDERTRLLNAYLEKNSRRPEAEKQASINVLSGALEKVSE